MGLTIIDRTATNTAETQYADQALGRLNVDFLFFIPSTSPVNGLHSVLHLPL